jgi:hypothetical protein
MRFDDPPAERQPRPVRLALRCSNGAEQTVGVALRETAAFILDLEQDPLGTHGYPKDHGGVAGG